jgi:hypothetical protein
VSTNLPSGESFGVQRQDSLVEITKATLTLTHDHGFKRAFPVPWNIDIDLAYRVGLYR